MRITQTQKPVAPAQLLKRELDARALTVSQAAEALGVPLAQLERVMQGRRLPKTLARALERHWGTPAATWLRLQAQFEAHPGHGGTRANAGRPKSGLQTAQIRITAPPEQLAAIQRWLADQGRGQAARASGEVLYAATQQVSGLEKR